jgi:hypothetical protein
MKLLINSDNLTNTSNVYKLISAYPIEFKLGKLVIHKIVIPQSYYSIIGKTIKINSTTVTITDGQYDIADLCALLQSLIRTALADVTYNVTYSSNTLAVTISHTGNFSIDFTPTASICSFLGFTATALTGAATYTGTLAYNPYKMGTIGFCSDLFSYGNEVENTASIQNLICWLPQTDTPDLYVIYEPNYIIDVNVFNKKTQLRDTLFWFIRPDGSLIDFRGVQWFAEIDIF